MSAHSPSHRSGPPHLPARPVCCHCGKPLRPGEPHWAGDPAGRPWHYACAERAGVTTSWFRARVFPAVVRDPGR